VKLQGGVLEQMLREVEIECLPGDIPGHLVADVSKLEFGQTIRISDLAHDDKLKFITREPGSCPRYGGEGSCGSGSRRSCGGSRSDRCRTRSHQEGQGETEGEAARVATKQPSRRSREEEVSAVKLIVGLGNPGIEYQFTPHNMGFLAVDRIAEQCGVRVNNRHCRAQTARTRLAGHEVVLAKPETFMNLSGASVASWCASIRRNRSRTWCCSTTNWTCLSVRCGCGRGPLGGTQRRGIADCRAGTQEITRVRMGVGPDHPVGDGARYVLSQFKKAQLAVVDQVLDEAAEAVKVILADGVQRDEPFQPEAGRRERLVTGHQWLEAIS